MDDDGNTPYALYEKNARYIKQLVDKDPVLDNPNHERLPYRFAEVVWAVRSEMVFFLDDVLSRRTRALPRVSARGVSADKDFHGPDIEISNIYGWKEIVLVFTLQFFPFVNLF